MQNWWDSPTEGRPADLPHSFSAAWRQRGGRGGSQPWPRARTRWLIVSPSQHEDLTGVELQRQIPQSTLLLLHFTSKKRLTRGSWLQLPGLWWPACGLSLLAVGLPDWGLPVYLTGLGFSLGPVGFSSDSKPEAGISQEDIPFLENWNFVPPWWLFCPSSMFYAFCNFQYHPSLIAYFVVDSKHMMKSYSLFIGSMCKWDHNVSLCVTQTPCWDLTVTYCKIPTKYWVLHFKISLCFWL